MIDQFLNEEQDPKAVEKVYLRLTDLLTKGEEIIYIATQKKPLVNLFPECVALTNKRVLFFSPANLGLSLKFTDFVWKDIADVHTKEEIIGAIFSVETISGAETGIDYLPRVQARKLYQYAQERNQMEREARRLRDLEEKRAESGAMQFENALRPALTQAPLMQAAPVIEPEPVAPLPPPPPIPVPAPAVIVQEAPKPDELTEKLKKLRTLFDNGLISQEEYNMKKLDLLNDF
jgi:hypothetical protein